MNKNNIVAGLSIIVLFFIVFSVYNKIIEKDDDVNEGQIELEPVDEEARLEYEKEVAILEKVAIQRQIPTHHSYADSVRRIFCEYNTVMDVDPTFNAYYGDNCFLLLKEDTGESSINLPDKTLLVFNINDVFFTASSDEKYIENGPTAEPILVHMAGISCSGSPCIKYENRLISGYSFRTYNDTHSQRIIKGLKDLQNSYN
jgi:hypothetical protein